MANTYLTRTPSSVSNKLKWTFSCWVKRSKLGASQNLLASYGASNTQDNIWFQSGDYLSYQLYNNGTTRAQYNTARLFRDTSFWYHIMVVYDAANSTAADRIIFYVNGERDTSGTMTTVPATDRNSNINNNYPHNIGASGTGGTLSDYFDGILSHVHLCDGYAYQASSFGSTDSTTGEWQINTSPSVSYGTNGFFILKDTNSGTDQSGQSNNLTVGGGTLTKTEDCPSNVFATLNPLTYQESNFLIYAGNTAGYNTSSSTRAIASTLAFPNTGKYYAEMKIGEVSSNVTTGIISSIAFDTDAAAEQLGTQNQYESYAYQNNGNKISNGTSTSYGNSFSGGIIGIAVDMDNKNIYFSKDGVWQNSGNPESGATGTGAAFTDLQNDKDYMFAVSCQGSNPRIFWNFGNGYFDTTAVSSAGTNASGIGIFEYDVPTGYTALSTKGLNL